MRDGVDVCSGGGMTSEEVLSVPAMQPQEDLG
jgi:hypothetical protein